MTFITWELKNEKIIIETTDVKAKKLLYDIAETDQELHVQSCWGQYKINDMADNESPSCLVIPEDKITMIVKNIAGLNFSFDVRL